MAFSDLIGTLGVSLLLVAFFLNLFKIIKQDSKSYILLNFVGAAIACYASVLIWYVPFIILEGTWSVVALLALLQPWIKQSR